MLDELFPTNCPGIQRITAGEFSLDQIPSGSHREVLVRKGSIEN